jgi:hypothetical protein
MHIQMGSGKVSTDTTHIVDNDERVGSVRTDYAAHGVRVSKNVISQMTDYVLPKCLAL